MKLISMTAYVLSIDKIRSEYKGEDENIWYITIYAEFLKRPLKLEMFVPCDSDGNVIVEPAPKEKCEPHSIGYQSFDKCNEEYQKAQEKVLFRDFEAKDYQDSWKLDKIEVFVSKELMEFINFDGPSYKVIEDLVKFDLELTDSAIKQLGL